MSKKKILLVDDSKVLLRMEKTKDIPINFVSTRGESENVEEGYASGGDAFVTKRIVAALLKSKLDAFLGDAK